MSINYNYTSNEYLNKNSSYFIPNNTGQVTHRAKNGPYNITEKDFGDHKVLYYIPSTYESTYDIPQLDEEPFYKQQLPRYRSPVAVRRQYYQSYDYSDDDYIEELPRISPRKHVYFSPRRPQVVKTIYYEPPPPPPPPPQAVEYIYEDDYRPKHQEIIEYVVQDRTPRQRYIEEFQPVHRPTHVKSLPRISRSPVFQLDDIPSPRRSKLKHQTPQTTPRKMISQNTNEQKHLSLKDVLAENRARRGSRIPKPRREVDQEEFHDAPINNKNFLKNDFLVHK